MQSASPAGFGYVALPVVNCERVTGQKENSRCKARPRLDSGVLHCRV